MVIKKVINLQTCQYFLYIFFKPSPEDILIDFRERGSKGEREGEKILCERRTSVTSHRLHNWDQTHYLGMCPG